MGRGMDRARLISLFIGRSVPRTARFPTLPRMRRGFLYLVAVMDWAARKVLSYKLSNTIETDFCVEALQEARAKYGNPEIFNTEQGSQFTSPRCVDVLLDAGVQVSMDGKGRWMDNVFIERLWRALT